MTTRELLVVAWDKDPFVLGLCVLALVGYGYRFRARMTARAGYFALAVMLLFLALASPIGVLSRGYLFSAHMLQHLLLVLVIPPLALLAFPEREDAATTPTSRRWIFAWFLGVGAMWLWHAPTLCDAASRSLAVQRAQTVSLLAMGAAFWWPIFGPERSRRLAPFGAMLYLFTACVACTMLGVLVTFSPVAVCSVFAHPTDRLGVLPLVRQGWGLTTKTDQEIGGLMMWVPACIVYAIAMLAMLARYYAAEDSELEADDAPAPEVAKEGA
jgi:cytochrome c oxidase assembly factor CtaG